MRTFSYFALLLWAYAPDWKDAGSSMAKNEQMRSVLLLIVLSVLFGYYYGTHIMPDFSSHSLFMTHETEIGHPENEIKS